jgi:hypothetical protein
MKKLELVGVLLRNRFAWQQAARGLPAFRSVGLRS